MRIVFGLDGSAQSIEAAHYLARLPLSPSPEVTAVTALTETQFDLATSQAGLKLRELERQAAAESFQQVQKILEPHEIQVKHNIINGHPKREILQVAEREQADLIILGAHGHNAISRMVLGSTSDYIANHAKCSVLIVRPTLDHQHPTPALRRIVLAFDGSDSARTAAQQLFSINWSAEVEIEIVMMLGRPQLIPEGEIYDQQALDSGKTSIKSLLEESPSAAKISYKVKEVMHVGDAISQVAQQQEADIVFMGSEGRSALGRFFLGSVSRYVVHHVSSSVWIARHSLWHE